MSLRRRITAAAALAVAAVSVVFGPTGYLLTRSKLIDGVKQELSQRAAPLVQPHPPAGQDGGAGDVDRGPGGARGPRRGHGGGGAVCTFPQGEGGAPVLGGAPGYFQTVCQNGRVVAGNGGRPELPVTEPVRALARRLKGSFFFTATVQGTHVEILAIADHPDRKAIEEALPLTATDSALHGLLIAYIALIAGGVVLAGLIGTLIARGAVAPILRFSAETEQVTAALDRPRRLEEQGAEELRRLAASFNQTLDALERSVQAQRHLIADASHELRTPMAALRSNIQIFLDAERLPEQERRELQTAIMAELDELTQLVADVLELARGSATDEHTEAIELDTIVREALERAHRRAPGITFEADLDQTVIENSPDRVSRAVTNVIDNARKWSPPDGVVEVSLRGGVLTVRDHGPGFADSDLGHVFDRFYRSDQARRMPGSGLGLAIVKQAAEAHGGYARAENAEGGGAVLRVSFGSGDEQAAGGARLTTPSGLGSFAKSG